MDVPDRDLDLETERLHALVDGLAIHAAMRPGVTTPDQMRSVIAGHLAAPDTSDGT